MRKISSLMVIIITVILMLVACGNGENENDSSQNEQLETNQQISDNDNEEEENIEEQEDLNPGDIESEIFSTLVAGSETYSVQTNGVDITEDGSVNSNLTVNLEIDDNDLDFDYMKQTAEEDTKLIGELLGEIAVIETADLTWLFNYHGPFYHFKLERDGDKLVVTEEDFDEEQLNKNIETYVPAS